VVEIPEGTIGPIPQVLDSYYETKQIVPFEIIINEKIGGGYYYHMLPEFNPLCFAKLKADHVAPDLIDISEKNMRKTNYPQTIDRAITVGTARQEDMSGEHCVYLAWIELWCASLWYQLPEEQYFRLEQLIDVLMIMKDLGYRFSFDMFHLIMQSCLNYGTPSMVIAIYQQLQQFGIRANGVICSIYFKAITMMQESRLQKKNRVQSREF
jgi:hypothetical protein